MKKIIGVLFGGKSAEHEVSVASAKNVIAALTPLPYDVQEICIGKDGEITDEIIRAIRSSDVVFPVLHGTNGEDGTIQGLLTLLQKPFVGAGVLGSAVGMDKDVMKRLLRDGGLSIGKFLVVKKRFLDDKTVSFDSVVKELGLPFFIKPANAGSSVGVHKVHSEEEFEKSLEDAFQYDSKVFLEEFIKGREIECAVLGNEYPKASLSGEIVPTHEFYDYNAKYIDEFGAKLIIPAILPEKIQKHVQELAVKVFHTLSCSGLARVDFFLTEDGKLYINEINTLPGFTNISMYPKLWEASGISNTELVERLIQLAIEKFEKGT